MTREEKIHKAATDYANNYGHFNCDLDDVYAAFDDGARWADENMSKDVLDKAQQSIIESASKLNWEDLGIYGQYGTYLNMCRAHKPLGDFLIRQRYQPKNIELYFLDEYTKDGFKSVEEAKKYASEMYENEIKKVLGL